MPRQLQQPSYRLHKARNCAVVTINGRNHYLGPWQSPESHQKYAALIAEWTRNMGVLPTRVPAAPNAQLSVNQLILAYFQFVRTHYVKHGKPTSEQGCLRQALRFARKLYGNVEVSAFGPRALKNVREAMVAAGRARKSINKDIHRIRRMFRWGVEEELIPATLHNRLRCVQGLSKGKTIARETPGVQPVLEIHVAAILPHLPPPVAAMVQFQLLTGARPQEAIHIRPQEVQKVDGGLWYYCPESHKTEHLDRDRLIVVGPRAQAILQPFLDRAPDAYCFAPAESVAWRDERRRKNPARPVQRPSEKIAAVNAKYSRHSYRLAVQRACRKAGVPVWCPRQLRHTRATQIRAEFKSIEAAKAVLGHADTRVTEIYADRDLVLAGEVMSKIG